MKAYISISYSKRSLLDKELNAIKTALTKKDIDPFVFVDHYRFDLTQERLMMKRAMEDIDACDLLIAETSDKGIGIGIEVGYAKAKGKPVIYVRNQSADHSTTVSGISDYQILYADAADLQRQLTEVIGQVFVEKK
jgi:2'-deoxynucleoside 5'-phosphate N-hydrolase